MIDVAILIPAYNEELTIKKVVLDFLEKVSSDDKVFVYNNNSTDNTLKILNSLLEKDEYKNKLVIKNEYKQGKGNVIRRMFREINANIYVLVDADDTYDVNDLDKLISPIKNKNADMVIGDRLSSTYYSENKRPFHNFGNNIVRFFINSIFKTNIKDIMTGYRAMSYNFVKTCPILSKGFEVETEMTIHALQYNMNIDSEIINYKDRPEGSVSKLNTYGDGIKVIWTIIKLYKNNKPFSLFTKVSLVFLVLSIAFFIPVFITYIKTNLVPRIPTLVVCSIFFAVAVITFFIGIVLQTIAEESKKNFEYKLNMVEAIKNNKT